MNGVHPVRRIREMRNLTAVALAEKARTTPETISRIENGHVAPQGATLRKLAEALGVKPEVLTETNEYWYLRSTGPLTVSWALSLTPDEFEREIEEAPYNWLAGFYTPLGEELRRLANSDDDSQEITDRLHRVEELDQRLHRVIQRKRAERDAALQSEAIS